MSVLKHQDSWPSSMSPRFSPKHDMKNNSQRSLREKSYVLTRPTLPSCSTSNLIVSQEDILTANLSPRSNTIPMIEIGKSLENLKGHDSSLEFNSLDNLDGFAQGLSFRGRDLALESMRVPNRQATYMMDRHWSLDTMLSMDEFGSLGIEDKHQLILKLLPLLKPFAGRLGQSLSGLDHAVGEAATLLDIMDRDRETRDRDKDRFQEQSETYQEQTDHLKIPVGFGTGLVPDSFPIVYTEDPLPPLWSPGCHLGSENRNTCPPNFDQIMESRLFHRRVRLNVGGIRHEVMWKMLEQIPHSRLGLLCKATTHSSIMALCADYSIIDNEYFFDRHPRSFNTILNFYRTGKLHIADEMCVLAFKDDLDYWGIPDIYLETCCTNRFNTKRENVEEEMEGEASKLILDDVEDFGTGRFARHQKFLWDLIEKPDTSVAAKWMSSISMLFVVVSTVGMTLNTMQAFQHQDLLGRPMDNPKLALVESVCISWFTLEYLLRFAGSPNKWDFLKDGMNIIDVLAIMPYYVSLFLLNDAPVAPPTGGTTTQTTPEEEEGGSIDELLQVFRIFKLARIFKLGRHSPGLQSIAFTLKQSISELGLMLMLILISGLIFASLCFFIEEEEKSGFTSIPTGIYWVVITMTTVGYGDIFPTTGLGKLVGSMCAISGVLVMSLPIPIIAGNFEKFHKTQAKKNKLLKRRAAVALAREKEEMERLAEITGGEEVLTPRLKAKSPVVSLLTARTWSSRRGSQSRKSLDMRSRANSTSIVK